MTNRKVLLFGLGTVLATLASGAQTQEAPRDVWHDPHRISRDIPATAANHPGNLFLAGEPVVVKTPQEQTGAPQRNESRLGTPVQWRAVDDANAVVAEGRVSDGSANLGTLGTGWYRLDFLDNSGQVMARTTAAVLARLGAPTPQDSPICVDSAMSWFARSDPARQERFAYLAALAGVNWIRDRMSWGGVQTGPDAFARYTTYDSAALGQAKYGLKVLQVFHDTPGWAADRTLDGDRAARRFPRDLRTLYSFCETMARRYEGRVLAWEPWNEANISMFGGHTIDEMCTQQKVAYLAFKAAQPELTVCWNVYAGSGTALHTQGVVENETWPYFETYNIHTYSRPDAYLNEFAPAREAAGGRPIWLTECGIGLHWKTQRPWSELSSEDERRQAQFIAPSYASSLFAGVNRHFFFILGNYPENQNQFGILRNDQTPRPAYTALAAVGHLLAGARPLGRLIPQDSPEARIYAFRAAPDGRECDVLVAWANQPTAVSWPPALAPDAGYDYLGRSLTPPLPARLTPSAVFVVLAKGDAAELALQPPMSASASRPGAICPVVLQLQMPESTTNLEWQAHVIPAGTPTSLGLFAYNLGDNKVSGTIAVQQRPANWEITPATWTVDLEPMERKALRVQVVLPPGAAADWVKLKGNFGPAGQPILAFRLAAPKD
ncbi:MAG: hypothetical protein NTZ17_04805 [Phycisphaerae bacterium]|nr:hypothetical protein [Phycisphaerae bacterium]